MQVKGISNENAFYVQNLGIFISPHSGRAGKALPELPKDQQRDWVNKNSDFVYVGADKVLKDIHAPAETLLAYERPGIGSAGRSAVAFADGHCELLPEQALKKKLKEAGLKP